MVTYYRADRFPLAALGRLSQPERARMTSITSRNRRLKAAFATGLTLATLAMNASEPN